MNRLPTGQSETIASPAGRLHRRGGRGRAAEKGGRGEGRGYREGA